ncbi:YARHG domain-containing protein [Oceanivirga salmonicida]|uniref:YARHG domain-containing protein n=1 Tax=Oceanivirga salmonicida TaxID=1769291 RepID=UPI000830F744|nr:YARHG domain-containing protein [Oceanivirga salmonicida]
MKKNIFIVFIMFCNILFADIKDCSKCAVIKYSEKDIAKISLLDLKILRNEIYARHNLIFNNDRLAEYFSQKYNWYKSKYESVNDIKLNQVEKHNIQLFLRKEREKEEMKKTVIKELKILKKAVYNKDKKFLKSIISKQVLEHEQGNNFLDMFISSLFNIFKKIDLDNVNWYGDEGLYKVITDNGFIVNEISLKISGNSISLSFNDQSHSELLNDENEDKAFSYGSSYDSTIEYSEMFYFEIQNNKIKLVKFWAAG